MRVGEVPFELLPIDVPDAFVLVGADEFRLVLAEPSEGADGNVAPRMCISDRELKADVASCLDGAEQFRHAIGESRYCVGRGRPVLKHGKLRSPSLHERKRGACSDEPRAIEIGRFRRHHVHGCVPAFLHHVPKASAVSCFIR